MLFTLLTAQWHTARCWSYAIVIIIITITMIISSQRSLCIAFRLCEHESSTKRAHFCSMCGMRSGECVDCAVYVSPSFSANRRPLSSYVHKIMHRYELGMSCTHGQSQIEYKNLFANAHVLGEADKFSGHTTPNRTSYYIFMFIGWCDNVSTIAYVWLLLRPSHASPPKSQRAITFFVYRRCVSILSPIRSFSKWFSSDK